MIPFNRFSTSSLVQYNRAEFCDISNPDTATPPALVALPGAYSIPFFCNTAIASGVVGILAPSATSLQPFGYQFSGILFI
jgi:hypothetical protein